MVSVILKLTPWSKDIMLEKLKSEFFANLFYSLLVFVIRD